MLSRVLEAGLRDLQLITKPTKCLHYGKGSYFSRMWNNILSQAFRNMFKTVHVKEGTELLI